MRLQHLTMLKVPLVLDPDMKPLAPVPLFSGDIEMVRRHEPDQGEQEVD